MKNAVFVKGMALVQKYNNNLNFYRVHVPAILCWRDLLILDGLAEKGVDIFLVLTLGAISTRSDATGASHYHCHCATMLIGVTQTRH